LQNGPFLRHNLIKMKLTVKSSMFLVIGIISNLTLFSFHIYSQPRSGQAIMKYTKEVETALVLMAISQDYSLVDQSSQVDFLTCVGESREELDFYPKKELVQQMERSALIENHDKQGSAHRENFTYFAGDHIKKEWKEITEEGSIVYLYSVTPKGLKFMSDVTKELSKPLPVLSISNSDVYIEPKILKEVIYDQRTIQNSIDKFIEKAKKQIEVAFSASKETDQNLYSQRFLICGANLWQRIEHKIPQPDITSGLRIETRTERRILSENGEIKTNKFPDQIILSEKLRQFWKTISESLTNDKPLLIKQAELSMLPEHLNQMGIRGTNFPPPDLANFVVVFVVESNNYKFVVAAKSEPPIDKKISDPTIVWIEILEGAK
jgi:hypothetical protein